MFTVTKTTQGAYTAYVLADTDAGTAAVVVPEKGGMVTSITKNGDEYSWLREPNFSLPERPRCAVPVLFPMCGRANEGGNTFGGVKYPMDIHGLVHSMPWEVVETGTDGAASVTVRVISNEETKKSYPFDFCVTIRYALRGSELRFEQKYANTGDMDMPFAFGFDGHFTNAVLWSQCQLGFVCMEPWNGFPASLDTPNHETLAPGAALEAEMTIGF